jgi:type III secretion protein R
LKNLLKNNTGKNMKLKNLPIIKILLIATFLFLVSSPSFASESTTLSSLPIAQAEVPSPDGGFDQPSIITKMGVLAGIAMLPFIVMLLTSFIKMIIVLSLLRNALGVQQTPPNQVLNGIAVLLTIYVMFPTGVAMYNAAKSTIDNSPSQLFSGQSAAYIIEVVDKSKEPLRDFLQRNCYAKHMRSFYQIAHRLFPEPFKSDLKSKDFIILIPSFITSQLKGAFEIGVLIYLPFFVIDLVTSNILLAMGMMMLSPLTIALPIKLLLLVMIDGWTILVQGLILTFK